MFHKAIGLFTIGRGMVKLSAEQLCHGGPKLIYELWAPVRGDVRWNPEMRDPVCGQSLDASGCGHIRVWDCISPPGESINHGEEVGEPLKGW